MIGPGTRKFLRGKLEADESVGLAFGSRGVGSAKPFPGVGQVRARGGLRGPQTWPSKSHELARAYYPIPTSHSASLYH